MRIFVRQSPRAYVLVSNDYALTIQATAQQQECLIHFQRASEMDFTGYEEEVSQLFHGLVGMLCVKGHVFFSVITDQVQVCSPRPSETVYKVKEVEFYCLDSKEFDPLVANRFRSESHQEKYDNGHPCSRIRKLLINGFYYSRDFDMTSVLQGRSMHSRDYDQMYGSYSKKFLWNHFMIQELLSFRGRIMEEERAHLDASELLTFLVRGFAKTANVNGDSLLTIISRVSCAKQSGSGPFGLTGVDEEGYVSNYVETEVLFYNKNYYFSYAQIRGNVPLFYEVENPFLSTKKVIITKNKELNEVAFDKHFENIGAAKLGNVYVINGLKSNSAEEELSQKYTYLVKKRNYPLINADLSREQLRHSPHKLSYLVKDAILDVGAFCYDLKKKVYIGKQMGVFRINTLNSMEKPGLIEKIISRDVLELSFKEIGLQLSPDLSMKHDLLWDENNTTLLAIYDKSLRRKGKKAFEGISNNLVTLHDPIHDYISLELKKRKGEYSSSRTIKVFAGTFNVNGEAIDDLDISSWIYPTDEIYDIAVIALEEVVELTASKMLITDDKKQRAWELKIKKTLGRRAKFSLLSVNQLGGIVLMFFVRDDQISEIKRVETREKKTGFGGMSANKGGVGVSFLYSSTRFCFVAAHLAAGLENVEQRQNDYKSIAKNMMFGRERKIKDHDVVVWLGDFNYRIDMSNDEVREAIADEDYSRLFERDQLSTQMIAGESFPYYNEMEIKFPPTYKFNKGTKDYDTSEKLRIPAWTDRILSRGDCLTQLSYDCAQDITFSDHRPVYATFKANVVVIDEDKKSRLTKELYEKRVMELKRKGDIFSQQRHMEEQAILTTGHGLPPPSTDTNKWWLVGGKPVKVTFDVPDGAFLNPARPVNPFVESSEPDWLVYE